jgi:hypothetical protein
MLTEEKQSVEVRPAVAERVIDWHLILALLLTVLVVVPRSILITRAHSESYDDD